jgi:hypothetical protein
VKSHQNTEEYPPLPGIILRKIIELEQQEPNYFFGEMSFDIDDLMRIDENGKGYVNILRLTDIQDKPKLFSTYVEFTAEIYQQMPEKEMLISRNL